MNAREFPGLDRVFEAVLAAKEAESGISIHLVDLEYDTGQVVRQCKVPISGRLSEL